ncbi:hypothetical protein ACIQF8_01275 [Pseudarthrobacter sp. NPDC092184]|uniref:hypothetical protein n=1 Tax=unclassified Pseudarthrobacter TaxID=2647000 RepID=UPI00380CBB35
MAADSPVPSPLSAARRRQGEMERRTRALIRSMALEGTAAQKLLVAQAVAGARALDEALAAGRPLSAAHKLHDAAIKGLEASMQAPEPDGPGENGTSNLELWVAAIHRPSVECQGAYPVVTPGECVACDEAVVARAQYGARNPDKPGHEYGMSREQCGCADCGAALGRES